MKRHLLLLLIAPIFMQSQVDKKGGHIWKMINEKTFENTGICTYVFYKTKTGDYKCIVQYIGSGCPVLSEEFYSVNIKSKIIELNLINNTNKTKAERFSFKRDKLYSLDGNTILKCVSNVPIIAVVGMDYIGKDGKVKERSIEELK